MLRIIRAQDSAPSQPLGAIKAVHVPPSPAQGFEARRFRFKEHGEPFAPLNLRRLLLNFAPPGAGAPGSENRLLIFHGFRDLGRRESVCPQLGFAVVQLTTGIRELTAGERSITSERVVANS